MQDFTYQIPTRIVFGRGAVSQIGELAGEYGKKALFLYGRSSIKRTGVYDSVAGSLKKSKIAFVEHGGVKSNPVLSHAETGIGIAKREKVDFILAVGGGSVIDEAKAIGAGVKSGGPLWDFYTRDRSVEAALPVVSVLTIPATSSEMNCTSVMTNEATGDKVGFSSKKIYPVISVLDPEITYTIPPEYTVYSGVDIISHLIEGYFTHKDPYVPIQEGFAEVLARVVIECTERCLDNPSDYQARATMMWAGSLAWSGLYVAGIGDIQVPNHLLEHPLSALYDVAHGAGLSIVIPAWMRYTKKENAPKFARFAHAVFGIPSGESADEIQEAAENGIEALKTWFVKIKSPVSFEDAGIPASDIDRITEQAVRLADIWGLDNYTKDIIKAIYGMCTRQ
jgi:alcohol dehydrogenase YqhD (iron-dependent ADH family)